MVYHAQVKLGDHILILKQTLENFGFYQHKNDPLPAADREVRIGRYSKKCMEKTLARLIWAPLSWILSRTHRKNDVSRSSDGVARTTAA